MTQMDTSLLHTPNRQEEAYHCSNKGAGASRMKDCSSDDFHNSICDIIINYGISDEGHIPVSMVIATGQILEVSHTVPLD